MSFELPFRKMVLNSCFVNVTYCTNFLKNLGIGGTRAATRLNLRLIFTPQHPITAPLHFLASRQRKISDASIIIVLSLSFTIKGRRVIALFIFSHPQKNPPAVKQRDVCPISEQRSPQGTSSATYRGMRTSAASMRGRVAYAVMAVAIMPVKVIRVLQSPSSRPPNSTQTTAATTASAIIAKP